MSKINIIFIILIITLFSGCNTTRALNSARARVTEFQQLNVERESRITELEGLLESARSGNKQISDLLTKLRAENDRYTESERRRLEDDRKLVSGISEIFKEGTGLIERLIDGLRLIRTYFEDNGIVAEDIIVGGDSPSTGSSDIDNID